MIDLKLLRSDPDRVRSALARRNSSYLDEVEQLIELDENFRSIAAQRDDIRSQVNAFSKQVGEAKRSGDEAKAQSLAEEIADPRIEALAFDGPGVATA